MKCSQRRNNFAQCAILSRMIVDEAMFICGRTYPKDMILHVCPSSLQKAIFSLNDHLEHGKPLDTVTVMFSTGIEKISICINVHFIKSRIKHV